MTGTPGLTQRQQSKTMSDKLYFPLIGKVDPVADKDQIIWVLDQAAKRYTNTKANETRYWLDVLETWKRRLIAHQAYEVLEHIKSHVTEAQQRRREKYRREAAERAEKEWKNFVRHNEKWKMMNELKKMITPN